MAKNCAVTAAKNGTSVEQSWKIVLKDVLSLAAVFWMSRQAPPNVTSKKQLRERLLRMGMVGRKAATLWGQSDFG